MNASSMIGTMIVCVIVPVAKVSVPALVVYPAAEVAVPSVVAKLTVTAPSAVPDKVTVKIAVPSPSSRTRRGTTGMPRRHCR